jgi:hypothetical protein
MTDTLTAAAGYWGRGWRPIPIPAGAKAPIMPSWQKFQPTQDDISRYFYGAINVGVILGTASGGLVDIDLDCAETVALADDFLPATSAQFGRASKPRSHRLYRSPGAQTRKFIDPVRRSMLVEIRSDGGLQTVFPPSVHPSGEPIEWAAEDDPAETPAKCLSAAVGRLAAAALVMRYRPDGEVLVRFTPFEEWPALLTAADPKVKTAVAEWLGLPPDEPRRSERVQAEETVLDDRTAVYVGAAFDKEIAAVAAAQPGCQSDTLNTAAFNLGQFIGAGVLDRGKVEEALAHAAAGWPIDPKRGNWTRKQIEGTIRSGIEAGIRQPRDLSGVHHHNKPDAKPNGASGSTSEAGEHAQPADEWPDPDLSAARQNRRAPPALPLEVFGPFWSEWLTAAAEAASCPVDYVVGPFLAAAAMLIGNARWVSPWSGWKEPPPLWVAAVGDPSSGKSPGADPVLDILSTIEAELAAGFEAIHREWATERESARCARDAWEKDVKTAAKKGTPPPIMPPSADEPVEPVRARIRISDATPEALGRLVAAHEKGLLFFRDELAGWFGSFDKYGGSGSDRAFWLEAYGGRRFTIDRVKHPLPIIIPRLTVGVLGGVQPERLTDLLNSPEDGLQARFLWLWPEKVPPCRPMRHVDVEAALEAFRRLIELPLVPGDKDEMRPFVCPLADDAADLFDQWRREHSAAELSGTLASSYGKAPGHLLRLALILEHLWWCAPSPATLLIPVLPPGRITIQAVRAAAALIEDYFKPMAERVFGDASLPEADRLAAIVARWILKERPEVVNARDLRRKARLPGLREAAKVRLALDMLVEADWLRPASKRSGSNAGRQREDYWVNPKLWEARDA